MEKKIFIGSVSLGSGAIEVVAIRAETEEEAKEKLKAEFPIKCRCPMVFELNFGSDGYSADIAYVAEYG